jgi:hypothetical protein
MNVKGVIITKEQPELGVNLSADSASGLLANGLAVSGKLALGTAYKLTSLKDAENLGLNEAYDTANNVVVYHHIKEFYSEVGFDSGTILWLMVVAQSVGIHQMVDVANEYAKKLLNEAEGEIFQMAIAHNPLLTGGSPYTPTITAGLDANLLAAIPKAQELAEYAFEKMYPIRFVLEGKFFNPAAVGLQHLRAITNVKAPAVSVVVGQDYDFAHIQATFNNYAAVGTALGTIARANVHENIGWVGAFNLTSTGRWTKAGFSNHQSVMNYEDDWSVLDDKGYIFPIKYSRQNGFRWNDAHTCTPIEIDVDGTINECYIHYSRTIDKAALQVYAALLPDVKSPQDVDDNGKLPLSVVAYFKAKAEKSIDLGMTGQFSGRTVTIDKNSNLLPPNSELLVGLKVQPFGEAKIIKVQLKISKTL